MSQDDFNLIKKMHPKVDDGTIRLLLNECRDTQDVLIRLENKDESTVWKKKETKSKVGDKRPKDGPRKPRAPRENSNQQPQKKAREQTGAILHKKKPVDFGPASNAAWSDIKVENGEIISAAKPPPSKPLQTQEKGVTLQKEEPVPDAKQPEQAATPRATSNNNTNAKSNVQQPQNDNLKELQAQQQVQQQANENVHEKPQRPKNASLFLPISLNSITPDLSKFGTFAGPLPRETPRRTPELVCAQVEPTFVVPTRPKVCVSNLYHHFEIKRPPSPPPKPKVQPPPSTSVETQTQILTQPPIPVQLPTQKEEPNTEIQQQQQQQIPQVPVSSVNSLPHVAAVTAVAPSSVGPVPQQPVLVNYGYPPFSYPYAYDPATAQAQQPPVAILQYPAFNQGGYPIPAFTTLPPGYPPMAAAIPQGAPQQQPQPSQVVAPQTQTQQQPQQQQQTNQRQIPKNYNNNNQQYMNNYNNNSTNNTLYQPPINNHVRPNSNY